MLIGLCGYARAGKDTVAQILVEDHGFRQIAFADALKKVLYDISPRLSASVDLFGWDHVKANVLLDGRGWLQRLGVACRQHLGPDVWVEAVMRQVVANQEQDWVISDVRFPNEIEAVRWPAKGELWRIDRPGVGPANAHISEHAWAEGPFDLVLHNDGTIGDLRGRVREHAPRSRHTSDLLTG